MKYTRLFLFALMGLFVAPAHADVFGFGNGRTASMDNMANMSVEGGASVGDFTVFGARLNYKLSPDLVLFGDLGQASATGLDGFVYGIGAFYQLRDVNLLENTDFAVKASFHTGTLEAKGCSDFVGFFGVVAVDCDVNAQEIAIEGLISGDQLSTTDFSWYANVGMHLFDGYNDFGIGGGIVGSLSIGEWYVGIDIIDGANFVGGIRYNLD